MSEKLEQVIAKVKKLLELAEGATKVRSLNEAKAAAARADALMQEYRITQAQLEAAGENTADPMQSLKLHEGGRRTLWRETLLNALCNHYGCTYYMNHSRKRVYDPLRQRSVEKRSMDYTVVGRNSDCQILEYMFTWLTRTIEDLSKIHTKGMGVAYARAWFDGAAEGVQATFLELNRVNQNQATSTAMVLLGSRVQESKEHMKNLFPDMKDARDIFGGRDRDGRQWGFNVGRKIEIKQGLPAKQEPETKELPGGLRLKGDK